MSAMEHLVPEQMFSTTENKAEGISAVKALAIASQQGQKIWTITEDNLELALSKITIDSDAKADIFNAVNAGKVVTAHEAKINFNGWIGEEYVIVDPLTGAGGYIIAGGGNGSKTNGGSSDTIAMASMFPFEKLGNLQNMFDFVETLYDCYLKGATSDEFIEMAIKIVLSMVIISLIIYLIAFPFAALVFGEVWLGLISFAVGLVLTSLGVKLPRCN
ncbi:MAG: hypothetical protein V4660_03590 [Pseudomonadota bacterium]